MTKQIDSIGLHFSELICSQLCKSELVDKNKSFLLTWLIYFWQQYFYIFVKSKYILLYVLIKLIKSFIRVF